jgi:hypothetical protein
MIHLVVRHLFKAVHHTLKHSSKIANSVAKPAAQVTPLAWLQAGKAHKHTTSFWANVANNFKFRN